MVKNKASLVNIKQQQQKSPKPWTNSCYNFSFSFQDTVIFTQKHFPYVYVHFWEYSVLRDPDEKSDNSSLKNDNLVFISDVWYTVQLFIISHNAKSRGPSMQVSCSSFGINKGSTLSYHACN